MSFLNSQQVHLSLIWAFDPAAEVPIYFSRLRSSVETFVSECINILKLGCDIALYYPPFFNHEKIIARLEKIAIYFL